MDTSTTFYTFAKTPYGISSFSYPSQFTVDGMTYKAHQPKITSSHTLLIEDVNGELVDCLTISECGEYWHTELNTVHVNEFDTLLEALEWAVLTSE